MPDQTRLQPVLHHAAIGVRAPALAVSARDGAMRGGGADGLLVADRRALHTLVPVITGCRLEFVGARERDAGTTRFVSVVRPLGNPGPDPTVTLEHERRVRMAGSLERFELRSRAADELTCELVVTLGADLADIAAIKDGAPPGALPASPSADGLVFTGADGTTVRVGATGTPTVDTTPLARLAWTLTVPAGGSVSVELDIEVTGEPDQPAVVGWAGLAWSTPEIETREHRLPALVDRSLADLAGLLMRDPAVPDGCFLAAGAPWFLTLFGRDSLIAASMMLPLGTDLARGTLRALAARQGRRADPATEEQPGKIPHELRRAVSVHAGMRLPALYYGTVDATPLWISLLHDAWRWGLPDAEVSALLGNLEAALGWLADSGVGPSGFVEYVDNSGGHGLSNQGWKDSGDSVRFADGGLARPPVALCEVQAYAYRAAVQGADLLEHFGRPGARRWRDWARELHDRFHAHFWVERDGLRYPAMALDRDGRAADAVTSNLGHLLGTGLLSSAQSAAVAELIAAPGLDSGFGLRTLDAGSAGFNPLGYHTGSVWPHDTAIAVAGLAADGHHRAAGALLDGLLRAAPTFDYRLPELFGGESGPTPLAYPASCRPQAWAAAASVALLGALVGLRPDMPRGRVSLRPLTGARSLPLTVRGLRVGGAQVGVHVDADGRAEVTGLPPGIRVDHPATTQSRAPAAG